jgi:hypothetical protein
MARAELEDALAGIIFASEEVESWIGVPGNGPAIAIDRASAQGTAEVASAFAEEDRREQGRGHVAQKYVNGQRQQLLQALSELWIGRPIRHLKIQSAKHAKLRENPFF